MVSDLVKLSFANVAIESFFYFRERDRMVLDRFCLQTLWLGFRSRLDRYLFETTSRMTLDELTPYSSDSMMLSVRHIKTL